MPIYVVLTMRSDFIGDCMEYPGLPEAVNDGQYLVPRMTRDELRSAITGPVAVARRRDRAAPRLRLLNDVGDDQDQLPVLQHALMRTWDSLGAAREPGDADRRRGLRGGRHAANALSLHAEEAYQETGSDSARRIRRSDLQGADRYVHRSAWRPAADLGCRARRDLRRPPSRT